MAVEKSPLEGGDPERETLLREKVRLEARAEQLQNEVKRMRRAQGELNQTLALMNHIQILAREMNSLEERRMQEVSLESLPRILRATAASLYVYDYESHNLRLAGAHHPREKEIPHLVNLFEAKNTIMEAAVRKKEILIIPDVTEFAAREKIELPHRERYETETCLVAPLMAGHRVVGVVNFADRQDGPFTEMGDMGFIEPLVHMLGLSLRNVQLHAQVQLAAKQDAMTGLLSHTTFFEESEKEVSRTDRYGSPLSLIMVDIDDFKRFNDHYGHLAGDLVIVETANILKREVRKTDFAGRYGGDEFAVLLPETALAGAYITAVRIRNRIKEHRYVYEGQDLNVCVSVGVCQWAKGMSVGRLIELGDEGLYRSKRAGKDQVHPVGEGAEEVLAQVQPGTAKSP